MATDNRNSDQTSALCRGGFFKAPTKPILAQKADVVCDLVESFAQAHGHIPLTPGSGSKT